MTRRLEFTVPPAYDGRKVVHFLRGEAGCSYTLVRSLKTKEDGILLNGARARTIDRLRAGDRLAITLRDGMGGAEPDGTPSVPLLYEDDDIAVSDKPAGMACHPVRGMQSGTLANVFARDCRARGQEAVCRLMGRLDRDTSGAVVIAKNAFAAAALTGQVEKAYLALVTGAPEPRAGTVDAPVGQPDRADPRRRVVPDGKPAVTHYETLAEYPGYSLVRCTLETGRTHQIRVHMAHLGCPLLGDALYGGDRALIGRHALHCAGVSFTHPVSGVSLTVRAPFPKDMQKLAPDCAQTW